MTHEATLDVLKEMAIRLANLREHKILYRAICVAIPAVEKQIPRKAKELSLPFMVDDGTLAQHLECKNCGESFIVSEGTKYCPCCGQAIDWGGAND